MSDYIVSAMSANEQIRAFACTTRDLVEHARSIHNTSPVMSAALGRMLSAAAMMGSMMKGDKDLLTLQIKGAGPAGGITVTADSLANAAQVGKMRHAHLGARNAGHQFNADEDNHPPFGIQSDGRED